LPSPWQITRVVLSTRMLMARRGWGHRPPPNLTASRS
jgi:hypothetical protein